MEKNIQSILEELYIIDPGLKSHESEIAQIIADMVKHKPDTQFDEQFSRELKNRVLEQFSSHESLTTEKKLLSFFKSPFVYTLGGVLATIAVALPIVYTSSNLSTKIMENSFTAGTRIAKAVANAYGPLSPVSLNSTAGNTVESAAPMANVASGAGFSGVAMDAKISARPLIYNPVYINYHFTLQGELPELSDTIEVLKRESGLDAAKQYAGVFQKIQLGMFDLGKLKNAQVQNFSLAEDREEGYMVNVDAIGGTISISQNYTKWQPMQTEASCVRGGCTTDPNQLSYNQVPADDQLIDIANNFLESYGIDMSSYGEGKVDNRWRISYAAAEDKNSFYISNAQSVVYQFMINGKPVYEEYGEPMGIRVTVDAKKMKVMSVDGIITKTFSASSYAGETNRDRLKKIIEKGRMAEYAEPTKTVEAELENSSLGYMRRWQYDNTTGNSSEIFVPAIVVHVKDFEKLQEEGLWQNTIVIPLASEMLSELENQEPVQIMPYGALLKDSTPPVEVINPVPMSEPAIMPTKR